ncbi:MAG TPA: hypothetical protein VNK41_00040 [Vicinamibacterales bacterium]|nr:hypothetical protein [Vicinamibacterales bacterium]
MSTETVTSGRRVRPMQVVVSEVIWETADTVTLVYSGQDRFEYKAGQFLTIDPHQFQPLVRFIQFFEMVKKRKEPPRAYSMASAPHEPLAITVKAETWTPGEQMYPPLLSPFLVYEIKEGMPMTISGFTGPYVLPDDVEQRTDHVVHLCAGSGSVPDYAIVKSSLRQHARLRHTFVYSNKTWDDVIYRDALNALALAHPGRLRVIHTLTRQKDMTGIPPDVRTGRITADLIREVVPDYDTCLFYACGPAIGPWERLAAKQKGEEPTPRFMETVRAIMKELNVPKQRFKEEAYG